MQELDKIEYYTFNEETKKYDKHHIIVLTSGLLENRIKGYQEDEFIKNYTVGISGYIRPIFKKDGFENSKVEVRLDANNFINSHDLSLEVHPWCLENHFDEIDQMVLKFLYWTHLTCIKKSCRMLELKYKIERLYDGIEYEIEDEDEQYKEVCNFDLMGVDYIAKYDDKGAFIDGIHVMMKKELVEAFLRIHKTFFNKAIWTIVRGHSHTMWAKAVKERDRRCAICGSTENLEAHHIKPFKDNEALRYDVNNGQTLCKSCHRGLHNNIFIKKYKFGNN